MNSRSFFHRLSVPALALTIASSTATTVLLTSPEAQAQVDAFVSRVKIKADATSVSVRWKGFSSSGWRVVVYGTNPDGSVYQRFEPVNSGRGWTPEIVFTDLAPNTTYYVSIQENDYEGNVEIFDYEVPFTTKAR